MYLKEWRDKAIGLADLLNYAVYIDDGIIQGKDGSLIASWYFYGSDMESSSTGELESLSARLNLALMRLEQGFMMQIDCIRQSAPNYPDLAKAYFQDATSLLIDYEREQQYKSENNNFESLYALTITYTQAFKAKEKIGDFLYEVDGNQAEEKEGDKTLIWFKKIIRELELSLAYVFNNSLTRMKNNSANHQDGGNQLLEFLNYCVTGRFHKLNLPISGMYLDSLIGNQDFTGGNYPQIGNTHLRIVSIEGLPMESYPSVLSSLNYIATPFRWNSRFIFFDNEEAKSLINTTRKRWKQKIRSFKDQILNTTSSAIDYDAVAMADDAENAMSELASNMVKFGDYTSSIILMNENLELLESAVELVAKTIRNLGFAARIETVNSVESYLGSLPGHGYQNIRKSMIHTINLADLLPLTSVWPGLAYHPCPFYPKNSPPLFYSTTTGNSPFRVSLHVGDVGHTLILGPTGAGKSTLLSFMMAQHFRYQDAKVFCFDKGYSAYIIAKASGGEVFDILGENSALTFCPLANIDQMSERFWAKDWIETLLIMQDITITPNIRQKIHEAIELLSTSPSKTMSDFINTVQAIEIREALLPYSLAGSMGMLLDADIDGLNNKNKFQKSFHKRFQVFEMEHLMNLGAKSVVPVLTYLFHKIEKNLDGAPTLLILDEAWLFISHPMFRDKIREWLKVMRKNNVAVIFATQSISDIANSPIREVIYESCQTKILLPNMEANNEFIKEEYRKIGLNDRQIELIKYSIPKKHYYYLSPYGRRLFELKLGPLVKAFIATNSKEEIKISKLLQEKYQKDWQIEWLKYKNLQNGQKFGRG
ncbi:Type IV secretion system protein virB4 [Rickettsiales bacterium Ac37b]|nr:Type IV secretion system protein virB4 [Rickettsiales bacterium Ac37b]